MAVIYCLVYVLLCERAAFAQCFFYVCCEPQNVNNVQLNKRSRYAVIVNTFIFMFASVCLNNLFIRDKISQGANARKQGEVLNAEAICI